MYLDACIHAAAQTAIHYEHVPKWRWWKRIKLRNIMIHLAAEVQFADQLRRKVERFDHSIEESESDA